MPRKLAITIGINHYRYHRYGLSALKCAENDAVAMQAYLESLGFNEVYRYSDNSPPLGEDPTFPERTNLLTILDSIENQHSLTADDCFWFFFSGHGASQHTSDYLMPTDGNPRLLEDTAISTNRIIRALKRSGAGNIVLILDMCRNEIPGKAMGNETERIAKREGIITLFSCSPGELSYELRDKNQGAFTWALLEALRGECCPMQSNAKELSRFLQNRMPQLVQQFGQQTPWLIAEPYEKGTQILLPPEIAPASSPPPTPNLDKLKAEALTATYINKDFDQAEKLWEQIILLATNPEDRKQALDQIRKIGKLRVQPPMSEPQTSMTLPTAKHPVKPEPQPPQTISVNPSIEEEILRVVYEQLPEEVLSIKNIAEQLKLNKLDVNQCFADSIRQGYFQPLGSTLDGDTFIKVLPKGRKMLISRFAPVSLESQDDLGSEKGVDYTKLRDLLKAGKWKEADQETADRMLEAMGKGSWWDVEAEDLLNFPCKDLKTLDQLWVKYSNGKWGFSVQKRIYVECGAKLDGKYPGDKIWRDFGDRVGWRKDGSWQYDQLTFDLSISPLGEFPRKFGILRYLYQLRVQVPSLAQRLVNCSTSQS